MLAPLFTHFLPNSRVVERFNILTPAITILLLFIVGCKYFSQNHFDDIKFQNKDTNWKRYDMWEFIRSSNQWWTFQIWESVGKFFLNPFCYSAPGRKKKLSRILMHLEQSTTYFRPSNLCLVMTCVTYHA